VSARKPALPCPPWCRVDHGKGETVSHQARRDFGRTGLERQGDVTLYLSYYGTEKPDLACYNGQVSVHLSWEEPD
jgi:hypothetical protein